jgi:predicted kinase
MSTLHLMIGLPCSGKTTLARKLEKEYNALLLTPDIWHLKLFGNDFPGEEHDRNHNNIESIMRDVCSSVLKIGVDVILDFGFWARVERDEFRKRASEIGANFRMHYLNVPKDELFRRLEERNKQQPDGVFVIPREFMEKYMEIFQPPTPDELV